MKRVLRIVACVVLGAATIAALYAVVFLPLVCEANVTRAIEALDDAAERGEPSQRSAAAYADFLLRRCACFERVDFKLSYVRGTARRYNGDAAGAIDAYRRALAADRRPEIYIDLGRAQLDALDRAAAVESFAAAGAFAPASLDRIPYADVRRDVERRIRERYGDDWLR